MQVLEVRFICTHQPPMSTLTVLSEEREGVGSDNRVEPPHSSPRSHLLWASDDGTMAGRERVSLRTGLASTDLDLPLL